MIVLVKISLNDKKIHTRRPLDVCKKMIGYVNLYKLFDLDMVDSHKLCGVNTIITCSDNGVFQLRYCRIMRIETEDVDDIIKYINKYLPNLIRDEKIINKSVRLQFMSKV